MPVIMEMKAKMSESEIEALYLKARAKYEIHYYHKKPYSTTIKQERGMGALHWQITQGDCNTERSKTIQMYYIWDEWKALEGMDKLTAKVEYIILAREILQVTNFDDLVDPVHSSKVMPFP